ncbi:MAG: AarF/ABC1/UbiB kinase family protein, partial [Anaerolineales bacterium]|nr:AarF/ABC1/UbiB kinase family protein [Anaerolineales bacterium]
TIVRPGFTENVLRETHDTLLEELDFYKEARFQEIFRRRAHKAKRNFFSAPNLYPEFCGEDVIVQEFVSGIWLSELLAAVETEDAIALDKIRRMNIDPKVVARRLLWVSHWGLWESTIFHADPHPANLIVQPDNRLVFIDFGAMGALTESRRVTMHQIFSLEKEEDLEGITRISLTLLEPLPPIDTEKVLKAIENVYWEGLIATRSKQSAWWERTSAQLWLGFFRVTSRFQIPMSFDTVRMIRATLLYDTLAARLDHEIDIGKQYRRFMKDAGDNAKGRVQKRVRQRLEKGLTEQDYVMIERVLKMSQQAIYQAHRLLNLDTYHFASLVGKFVSTLLMFLALVGQILLATAVVSFLNLILQRLRGADTIGLQEALLAVIGNPWYQAIVVILVLLSVRRSFFRLRDKEM